jgi:imidazolonepropionase-like amidohydrolase
VYHVRGVLMPAREQGSLWIDKGRLRLDPVREAELIVDGGWILPGLVDVHTHPGTERPSDTFSDETLRRHLIDHRDAGVLLLRAPGTAARIPDWVHDDPKLPRVRSAGRWLATPGRFFPGYGRDVTIEELPTAAVEEVRSASGWCKVIGDWTHDGPAVPLATLKAVTDAVHAIGGKVAVHCQTAEGCRNAVLAGADSLEHGMHLDPSLLDQMAAQGTALVPTLSAFAPMAERLRPRDPFPARDWLLTGFDTLLPLVRDAHDAGVTVLAGTDSVPFGKVVTEVEWLIRAELPAEAALGAASWTARSWLGLPGLLEGAPADLTVYPADPTREPDVLRHPTRVILNGQVIR